MLTLASPVKFNRNYFRSLHSKRRRLAVRLLRLLPVLRKGRWLSTGNRFFANRTPQINSKLDSFGSNLRLPAEWAILSARRDCVALVVDAARFRIQLISDSCRHIFGGEPADFTSQCLENIVHPSDWPALCEGLMRLTSIRPTSNSPSLSSMTVGLDTLELSSIVRDINLLLPLHAQLQPLHVSIKVSTGFYEYCLVDLYGHLFAPSETSANLFSQENTHHLNSFVLVATDRVEALCSGHPPESAARTNLKATLNLLCLDERQLVLCRLLLSLDGIILFASPALTYVLGWRPFDLTNKSIYNLLKPPYDAAMAAIMMNATTNMSHTSSLETLTLLTSRGGPDVPVKIHLQPVVRPFGLSSSLCFGVTVQAIGALPPSYSSTDATFSSAIPLLHFPVSSSSTSSLSSTVPLADLPSLQPVAENTWLDPSVDHNHNLLRHHRPPAQSSSSSSSSSSSLFQHAIIYQEQPTPSTFSPHLPPTNNEFDPPLSQVAKINVNILANTKPHQHVASTEDTRPNPPVTVSSSSSPLLPLSIGVASLTVDATTTTTTTTNNNNNNNNNDDNNDDGNDDDKDSNTSSASTPPPPSPRPSATTTKTSPSGSGKNNGRRRKRGKARRKPVVSPTNSSAPTKKNTEPRVPKRNMATKKEEQRRAREKLQEENEKQNLTSPESSPAQDFYHTPHKRAYKKQPRAPTERRCESCNTGVTPEWRRGPNGPKTLCNACGLQFAKRVKQSSETSSVSSGSSSTTIGQHMELKTDPNPNEQTRPDAIDSNVSDAEHSVPRLQLSLPDFSNWSNPLATNSNSQTSIVPSTTLSFLGARGWVPPIRHDNVNDDDDEDEDEVEGYNHDDEDDSADNLQ